MSQAEPSRQLRDLLATCGISDPSSHCTCIGTARKGACGNKVSKKSRETALHRLEVLALCHNEFSIPKLLAIAGSLLCKRWHQDQSMALSELWFGRICQAINLSQVPTPISSPRRHRTGSTASTVQRDADPATVHQRGQTISAATVRDDQIGFHVSSSRRAVVTIPTATGASRAIVLCSFRTGRDILDVDCGICREHHSHDVVYLNCTECTGEFHLECMEGWLMHRSPQSNFTCPSWYEP